MRIYVISPALYSLFSDRSNDSDHAETTFQRSLEGSFYMIAMIATIDELFLLSDRSDHSDGMETRLKKIIATWFQRLMFNSFFSYKSYANC